jgi:hypothetical protein
MTRYKVALTLFCVVLVVPTRPAHGADLELSAVDGIGWDWETAENMPLRCLAGLGLSHGPLELTLFFDVGIPWEPAALFDASLAVLELDFLRFGPVGAAWSRDLGGTATETGMRIGARMELGPRILALTAGGGWSVQSTRFAVLTAPLADSAPWARLGIASWPMRSLRLELAMASDNSRAIWLRTSFEVSASWEALPGLRFDGQFALQYSDFFTLTSYLDGIETRLTLRVPIVRLPPPP